MHTLRKSEQTLVCRTPKPFLLPGHLCCTAAIRNVLSLGDLKRDGVAGGAPRSPP